MLITGSRLNIDISKLKAAIFRQIHKVAEFVACVNGLTGIPPVGCLSILLLKWDQTRQFLRNPPPPPTGWTRVLIPRDKQCCHDNRGKESTQCVFFWGCPGVLSSKTLLNYQPWAPHTRYINPMLGQCWSSVFDAGPTLTQHRVNAGSNIPGLKGVHWAGLGWQLSGCDFSLYYSFYEEMAACTKAAIYEDTQWWGLLCNWIALTYFVFTELVNPIKSGGGGSYMTLLSPSC